jgi:DNA invertase Pin-like site-specific DNA recombinase
MQRQGLGEIVARIEGLDVSASDKGLRLDRPGLVKAHAPYPVADVLMVPKLDRLGTPTVRNAPRMNAVSTDRLSAITSATARTKASRICEHCATTTTAAGLVSRSPRHVQRPRDRRARIPE